MTRHNGRKSSRQPPLAEPIEPPKPIPAAAYAEYITEQIERDAAATLATAKAEVTQIEHMLTRLKVAVEANDLLGVSIALKNAPWLVELGIKARMLHSPHQLATAFRAAKSTEKTQAAPPPDHG